MVSLSIVLKLKAKNRPRFPLDRRFDTCNNICSFILQKGALDRGRDRSAMRLEVIFHRKGFLPMLDPSNLTRRKVYKTRVKGIWRCVENVSINCPFFLKQIGYACTFST